MKYHLTVGLFLALSVLTYLTGSHAEPPNPAGEPPTPSPELEGEKGAAQSSADVEERAVPRLSPRLAAPLAFTPPTLPGEFVLQTYKGNYITAVNGGGRTTNVLHTDAAQIGTWEKFRILGGALSGQYNLQTLKGNFLTAVNGGGSTSDAVHTDATKIGSWEQFRFNPDQYGWRRSIQTVNGHFLTAVGGGGKTSDAIHADAVRAGNWEEFYIWKCGDLGSGHSYTISAVTEPYGFIFAYGGGGRVVTRADVFVVGALGILTDYTKHPAPFDDTWQRFRLIRQSDGSYAIQTSNSVNYVTAIRGGGLASGTATWDDLVTDRTRVQAWEKFRFIEQANCTYVIQTVSGQYLGKSGAAPGTAVGVFSTNVTDVSNATKFRLGMVF
jgi:hypothetical protein